MKELIEDYELKLEVILEMIKEKEIEGINSVKLNAIARCYKGFLKDLNQSLNIDRAEQLRIAVVVGQSEQLKHMVFELANKLAIAGHGDEAVSMHRIHNRL